MIKSLNKLLIADHIQNLNKVLYRASNKSMSIVLYESWLYLGYQEFIKECDTYLIKNLMIIIFKCLSGLCAHVNKANEFHEFSELNMFIAFFLSVYLSDLFKKI